MLTWAFIFILLAIVSGIFGFTGIATAFASMAQIFFYLFLVALVISLVLHFTRAIDRKTNL